jgi:hypothetical protein
MNRKSPALGIVLGVASTLLALIAVLYVGGYFFLCNDSFTDSRGELHWRHYPADWVAFIYQPAAMVDGAVTGRDIHVEGD